MPRKSRPATRAILLVAANFGAAPLCAQPFETDRVAAVGSGNDLTRPLNRFEISTELVEEGDGEATTITLRGDRRVASSGNWTITLRTDLPLRVLGPSISGPEVGDLRLEATAVHRREKGHAYGIGMRTIIPTGGGEWRIVPYAGYRWPISGTPGESYFQVIARYDHGFGGREAKPGRKELQFAPTLEMGVTKTVYVAIFPSTDIRYDFRTDELFVPLNAEIGVDVGRSMAVSVEGGVGIISGKSAPYDWKIEARMGFRF